MAPHTVHSKDNNPNEHLKIPEWITVDYFQPIVEKDIENFQRIIELKPIAATQPGENYTSVMVRVLVDVELKDGSTKETSYILKTTLGSSGDGAAIVSSMGLFPREQQMYQTILPNFVKLYKEAGVHLTLMPRCLHVEDTSERITLIMEDLSRQGFINANRLNGLNFEHMRCVLEKLAELHAASAVLVELNGQYDDIFMASIFTEENRKMFETMGKLKEESFEESMHVWNLENIKYYMDNTPKGNEFFDAGKEIYSYDPNEFNVLNHGDCWVNNIMFTYKENGEVKETRLVDFQIAHWGSPAQDLWYFIVSSAALDIKTKEFDHFLYIYHKRLIECLKLLKYQKPLPTLKDLHILMLKYGFWAIMTATGVLSVILLPSEKDANMDNFLHGGAEGVEFRKRMLQNPTYVKAMCQLYPFLDRKGLLAYKSNK